ncbi:TPA: hypothetical protein ROY00_004491, partial [Bacillus mobilis]|nr:hypothetical protein [Bacillus mobilis]
EATKEKAKSILEQEKSGKLTREQAQEELTKLGVKMPEGKRKDMLANLDEATKEKVKSIFEQEKSGKLTHEQAKEELTKLGVKLPEKEKHEDIFAGLDEATKEKVKSILDNEKKQLEALNVDLPHHKFLMKKDEK